MTGLLLLSCLALWPGALPAAGARLPPGWPRTAGIRAYDAVLARYVVRDGVDYDGLARDRGKLDAYLWEMAAVDSTALRSRPEAEQKAFWINAYNALTLDLVLLALHGPGRRGPRLRSIREIPDAFSRPLQVVAGARRSLNEIEKGILRGRFHDPRIHFALVCASRSCPALRPRAYTGDSLEAELKAAARAFLSDPTRNDLRISNGAIRLSRIFDWYGGDFARSAPLISTPLFESFPAAERDLLLSLAPWFPPEAGQTLAKSSFRIEFLPYDWSLNDVPARR